MIDEYDIYLASPLGTQNTKTGWWSCVSRYAGTSYLSVREVLSDSSRVERQEAQSSLSVFLF